MSKTLQTIEVLTDQSEHWYPSPLKKGLWYPSVTTVVAVYPKGIGFNKYLTEQSSWQSAQEQLEEAGARGTKIHQGTELLERGEILYQEDYQTEEWLRLIGFHSWFNEFQPKVLASEYKVVSDKLKTGGTIDRIYEINGKTGIIDIKTSRRIYNNYWIQVAAYEKLIAETKQFPKVDFVGILRLTPLRKDYFEYVTVDDWESMWKVFKSCQEIWRFENGADAQPKILTLPTELSLKVDSLKVKVPVFHKYGKSKNVKLQTSRNHRSGYSESKRRPK